AAIFVSLGLGLVLPVWYLRTKRQGWLVSSLVSMLLWLSFTAALLHGWVEAAGVAVAIASTVFLAAGVVVIGVVRGHVGRVRRDIESDMRELGRDVFGAGPLQREVHFRDDGERLAVYPSRRRLLGLCARLVLVLGAFGSIGTFDVLVAGGNVLLFGALGVVGGGIFLFLIGATLSRVVRRQPTLLVGPDGILEGGSLIATGMGLLQWNEILGVTAQSRSAGWVTRQ